MSNRKRKDIINKHVGMSNILKKKTVTAADILDLENAIRNERPSTSSIISSATSRQLPPLDFNEVRFSNAYFEVFV